MISILDRLFQKLCNQQTHCLYLIGSHNLNTYNTMQRDDKDNNTSDIEDEASTKKNWMEIWTSSLSCFFSIIIISNLLWNYDLLAITSLLCLSLTTNNELLLALELFFYILLAIERHSMSDLISIFCMRMFSFIMYETIWTFCSIL